MFRKGTPSTARVFLSSTFRDFGEERDLLVRKVFPSLRERLKDRFVELVDVDLRWGITAEQAERGEVLPICLAEIDRSRPFFVGLLGERYGWIPPADGYPAHVVESQPWLEVHRGGKSVTELEILHGVLNDPKMAGRALFYFRSALYAERKGGDYVPASAEDARRQLELKERIRKSGFPLVEDYADPAALAERLEADLWAVLDETFPAAEVPDAVAREAMRHEAYAAPRRGLYLGGEAYLKALDEALASGQQWILIGGQSGGGKSALIANWTEALEKAHEDLILHVHYLGATADASDPVSLVRRLVETIRRTVGSEEEVPGDPEKLLEALPLWLANVSSWAGLRGRRFVIVIDALNGLTDRRDLRWFPSFLPERVQLVVSSLPGEVQDHLREKAEWTELEVKPLSRGKAEELFVAYLRRFNKELPPEFVSRIMDHDLVANPLFLRTLAEELRLFGVHERLGERLEHYLTSRTVDDLFERVLERVEDDNGADTVRKVMVGLWASRAGLTEEEIRAWADLRPADWAYIRNALGNALLEGSGRIVFGHDYLSIAVSDRYLAGNNTIQDEGQSPEAIAQRQAAHAELARWFEEHAFQPEDAPGFRLSDARAAEEIPHQWREAKDWQALKASLTRRDMFEAMVSHRGSQELLSYWLDIEASTSWRVEAEYEAAWKIWAPEVGSEATGDLANRLSSFLREAGRYKYSFVEDLARIAIIIKTDIYGEDSPEAGARLSNLAHLLYNKGDYEESSILFRQALAISEKENGPDHPGTSTRLNNLAVLLKDKGDYTAAEVLYRRALAIDELTLGPDHPNTATSLNNLAALLEIKGDYAKAELFYREALAIREKALGRKHPDTAQSFNNLALLLEIKGDSRAAELLFRQALEIHEEVLGPDHPDTATNLSNLAALLDDTGDTIAADPILRRALAIRENTLGSDHPDTAASITNLAGLVATQGDTAVAESLYRRALLIQEKALGPEHPDTARSLNNLAALLASRGDNNAAGPLYRRALAIREKTLGPENLEVAASLNNLADLLVSDGDIATAEPLYRRALAIREKTLGSEHPDTATSLNNLAALLRTKGNYVAAEPFYRRALAVQEKTLGLEHPETAATLNNLAGLLRTKGNYVAAEPLYRRALAIREKTLGPEHSETAVTVNNLAFLLESNGDYGAAESLYRRALDIREKALGPEHPQTAISLNNLARLISNQGDTAASEPLFRRALAITEMTRGPEHTDTANCLNDLARLLRTKGNYAAAEPLYRRALAIYEQALGFDHPATAACLNNLAGLLQDKGDHAAAEPLYRRALTIFKKYLGPEHRDTVASFKNLTLLLQRLGRKGDPDLLLSRGDFLSIVQHAKVLARHLGRSELSVEEFLVAFIVAARQDIIWSYDITALLDSKYVASILETANGLGLDLAAKYDVSGQQPMTVAEDLRKIIGANSHASISTLLESIVVNKLARA